MLNNYHRDGLNKGRKKYSISKNIYNREEKMPGLIHEEYSSWENTKMLKYFLDEIGDVNKDDGEIS